MALNDSLDRLEAYLGSDNAQNKSSGKSDKEDLDSFLGSPKTQSLWERAIQSYKDTVAKGVKNDWMVNALAGGAEGVGEGVRGIMNIPHDIAGAGSGFQTPINIPLGNPDSLIRHIASSIGQYAPAAALIETGLPEAEAAGVSARALRAAGVGAGAGAAATSDNRLGGALGGAVIGGAIPILPSALGTVSSSMKNILSGGKGAAAGAEAESGPVKNFFNFMLNKDDYNNALASHTYNKLTNSKSSSDLNDINASAIRQNYKTQAQKGGDMYDAVMDAANKLGYAHDVKVTQDEQGNLRAIDRNSPSGSPVSSKTIRLSQPSIDNLKSIANYSDNDLLKPSDNLTTAIDNMKHSPSFKNAHQLQSALGYESADLKSFPSADAMTRGTIKHLNDTRSAIKESISNTLTENGDDMLGSAYDAATKNWEQNVIPYRSMSGISTVVKQGKATPKNVASILSKTDAQGGMDTIRSHMSPQQQSNIIAQYLSKGSSQVPEENPKITAENIADNIGKIPSVLHDFVSPDTLNEIKSLQQNIKGKNIIRNVLKGTGIMGAAGGASEIVRKIIGEL